MQALTALANLGAELALQHNTGYGNKDRPWYFRAELTSPDGTKVSKEAFGKTQEEVVDEVHRAILRIAERGIDLKQLAPPVEEKAFPQEPLSGDDVPF